LKLGDLLGNAVRACHERFCFGGTTYDSWGAVPDRYKVGDPLHEDPSKSVVPIFKFTF
jgi:hypothetical protein